MILGTEQVLRTQFFIQEKIDVAPINGAHTHNGIGEHLRDVRCILFPMKMRCCSRTNKEDAVQRMLFFNKSQSLSEVQLRLLRYSLIKENMIKVLPLDTRCSNRPTIQQTFFRTKLVQKFLLIKNYFKFFLTNYSAVHLKFIF